MGINKETPLYKFVGDLSHDDRHAIIKSYEQWVTDGVIGDEPIRVQAQRFCESIGISSTNNIALLMNQLANECFRYYYHIVYWGNNV